MNDLEKTIEFSYISGFSFTVQFEVRAKRKFPGIWIYSEDVHRPYMYLSRLLFFPSGKLMEYRVFDQVGETESRGESFSEALDKIAKRNLKEMKLDYSRKGVKIE